MSTPDEPQGAAPTAASIAPPIPAIIRPTKAAARPKAPPPPAAPARLPDLNDPARPLHPRRIWPD
ncbi:MAG: hypothetical protein JZU52_08760 [Lamprocystis purpurea]|jgi:hypothetical protein|uniref:hypothetical protein n=1 Tax=Lamprocystis purpurea TaxID=61598 RepID=UPI00037AF5E2|nr:hypothetical protein [Lamprocystis purpurea]MBV5273718.1 hypothetical protein [Lamprocystis purpurea]